MRILNKQQTAAATPYPALLEGLRQMFLSGVEAPLRHHHTMARQGEADATLLLMPAWMPAKMDGKGVGGVRKFSRRDNQIVSAVITSTEACVVIRSKNRNG